MAKKGAQAQKSWSLIPELFHDLCLQFTPVGKVILAGRSDSKGQEALRLLLQRVPNAKASQTYVFMETPVRVKKCSQYLF